MENLTTIKNCMKFKCIKCLSITLALKIVNLYYRRKSKIKSLPKRM